MTKEQCGRCKLLDLMNTMTGPKDCCRYFWPPEALENVVCKQTQYGFGILVEPSLKKNERIKAVDNSVVGRKPLRPGTSKAKGR